MPERSVNIMIGGAAGQGLATVGQLLTRGLIRSGYHVLVRQDYMSRVRGGHNTFMIRVSREPVKAPREAVDVLVALNQQTVDLHTGELAPKGLIYGGADLKVGASSFLAIPFGDIAPKPIFQNVAALGVLSSALGLDKAVPARLLQDTFGKKGEDIVSQNLGVLDAAYAWESRQENPLQPLDPVDEPMRRLMMTGNEAIAMGALAAGVNFCSFYPMTPATSVAQNLINHGRGLGVVVEQAEDEIAAMNMGLGASFSGARAIVPTSGGGFALMTEAISLAGVSETPIVSVVAMRPGPATGLPTRTEQADLNLVLYAGHGEFPRAIFAPGTVEDFFELSFLSFDLAERYQTPIFMLSDQYMADSFRSVEPFDLEALPEPAAPLTSWDGKGAYERYAITESGVSPRVLPGTSETLVLGDSHEHLADGHITEDIAVRIGMKDKRLRKGCGLWQECVPPSLDGDEAPDLLLVSWGSTRGAAEEAAADLRQTGIKAASLHFAQVWPLREDQFMEVLEAADKVVCVEGNAVGQFAQLMRQSTGFVFDGLVLKYDGRPFTPEYIIRSLAQAGLTADGEQ